MKSVFSFKVDLSQIEGAISRLGELNKIIDNTQSISSRLTDSFMNGDAVSRVTILTKAMQGLRGVTGRTLQVFDALGKSIRSLASNFMSKFISVLKTGLGLVGALTGSVLGVFNMANGSNRTATDAAFSGLSWAGQKALNNANDETGLSLDFSAVNRLKRDDVEQETFRAKMGLSKEELSELLSGDDAFYKIARLFKSKYDAIEGDEFQKNETFKALFGEEVSNATGMDWKAFLTAVESGALGRHEERFGATQRRYSGVDAKALMEGEKALDNFSETLKAFALTTASRFLPGLTKALNSFTTVADKSSKWLNSSGLIESAASTISTIFGAFSKIAETLTGAFSETTGSTIIDFIKGVFSFIGNLAQLLANLVTGDWKGVASVSKDMWGQVKTLGSATEQLAIRGVSRITEDVVDGVNYVTGTKFDSKSVRETVNENLQNASEKGKSALSYVGEKASGLINSESRSETWQSIVNDVDNSVNNTVDSIRESLSKTRERLTNPVPLQTVSNTTINIPGQKPLKVQTVNNYKVDPATQSLISIGKAQSNVSGGFF